ncbi:MAG: hypothetical protein WAO78_07895 [Roseovarius sp.]
MLYGLSSEKMANASGCELLNCAPARKVIMQVQQARAHGYMTAAGITASIVT